MPLYLVRWPDLSSGIVLARDEDDLVDQLDEVANPEGATWTEYDGPLWIEFEVPARWRIDEKPEGSGPLEFQQIVVENVDGVERGELRARPQVAADAGLEMVEAIYRDAYPHLHQILYQDTSPKPPDPEHVRAAVTQELLRQVQTSWRIRRHGAATR